MKEKSTVPKAPGALPLIGHLIPLFKDPLRFLMTLPSCGDLARIRIGLLERVIQASHDLAATNRPNHEEQLSQVESDITKTENAIERYLLAFESGTLPEAQCGDRVRGLAEKIEALRSRRLDLLASIEDEPCIPESVDPIALRRQVLNVIDGDLEQPSRKALLRELVQEVRVESRESILPTFRIPFQGPVRAVARLERETRLELATLSLGS